MARTQTIVQLNDELISQLDDEAKRRGESRSALIRTVLTEYLERESEAAKIRQWVEGYKRMPQAGGYDIDEWGNLHDQRLQATRDTLGRLDAEDEAAGLTWDELYER